jgi:hypothetical protein
MENEEFSWLDDLEEEIEKSVRAGLNASNPRMVEVAVELRQQKRSSDILKNLSIEITPYKIKDVSLKKIVLDAPDYIIEEIEEALKERRRVREFGGTLDEEEDG